MGVITERREHPMTLAAKFASAVEFRDCGSKNIGDVLRDEGVKWQVDRLSPLMLAVGEVIDCADELNDILSDPDARKEIDSFTGQPMRIALASLVAAIEKISGPEEVV